MACCGSQLPVQLVQQDGASPHTAKANESTFTRESKKGGFNIKIDTQPARSPDLNTNDLAFFHSLKCDVRAEPTCFTKDGFEELVLRLYDEYDAERMERGWQTLIDVHRQILENNGRNYEPSPRP